MMKSCAKLVAQVHAEEMFLGNRAFRRFPALPQLFEQWQQQPACDQIGRVQRQRLVKYVFEPLLVETRNPGNHFFAVPCPWFRYFCGDRFRFRGGFSSAWLNLADRHPPVEQDKNPVNQVDVLAGVEPVALGRANRLDESMPAFPGAQRDRVDTRERGHRANRVKLGLRRERFERGWHGGGESGLASRSAPQTYWHGLRAAAVFEQAEQ